MVREIPSWLRLAGWVFIAAMALLLLGPLVVVLGVSVSESQFISFPPQGFSLRWYQAVLNDPRYIASFVQSLHLAAVVTLAATVLGGGAAIAIHRRVIPGAGLLATVFLSPLILPTIIYAVGLLMFWSASFGPAGFTALAIGHTVICLPYVLRTTLAVLATANPQLEEAARTMGAGRLQRLWFVVLPQCLPGLAAGMFFAFNISFDEAVLSLFLRQPDLTTLPVRVYGQLEFSPDPSVAAVSSIMIGVTVALLLVADRILGLHRLSES